MVQIVARIFFAETPCIGIAGNASSGSFDSLSLLPSLALRLGQAKRVYGDKILRCLRVSVVTILQKSPRHEARASTGERSPSDQGSCWRTRFPPTSLRMVYRASPQPGQLRGRGSHGRRPPAYGESKTKTSLPSPSLHARVAITSRYSASTCVV